jgi:hypothetical protein
VITNPSHLDRLLARLRACVIAWLAGKPELRWT